MQLYLVMPHQDKKTLVLALALQHNLAGMLRHSDADTQEQCWSSSAMWYTKRAKHGDPARAMALGDSRRTPWLRWPLLLALVLFKDKGITLVRTAISRA